MKPAAILTKYRILPRRHVYQLGCTARLLNVHSQQHRAFNLVWALAESGRLTPGTTVAVIGAGIAGIAAAIAAAGCGARVDIYDSKKSVMHLQRGNDTRFLHPNIALWPAKSFGFPLTNLPFFNWRAETAGHVIMQINRQWRTAANVFERLLDDDYLGTRVTEVLPARNKIIVRTAIGQQPYDVAILAVGYGLEKSLPSYWRNDDLAQPVLGETRQRRYFISGAGDGGLTELLRLTVNDFHHQRFIQAVMRDTWLINKAKKLARNGQWQRFIAIDVHRKKPDFLDLKRDDTVVYFGADSPFQSSKAQLLHRICAALLLKHHPDTVEYVEGSLIVPKRKTIKRIRVRQATGVVRQISVDALVDRRGTDQVLSRLFPNETNLIKRLRAKWQGTDPTATPQYPIGFLADELKTSHLEDRYQVGFLLRAAGDRQRIADEIFVQLGFNMPANIRTWLNQNRANSSPTITSPSGKQFTLVVQDAVITNFIGDDPQNYPQGALGAPSGSWRIFAPAQELAAKTIYRNPTVTCLFFNTSSRYLVEMLLASEQLPYQVYRVFLADTFENYLTVNFPGSRPDRFVNFDTERFMISRDDLPIPRKYFEVHTTGNMLAAHWLLRAPTMLEILLNRWPTTKVGGMGWAIGGTSNDLRNNQVNNKLLEWNPL